ncbi:hypothetical protein DCC39_08210 [Pueribacillus theae]|uniref:Uncharacterized protein n=1 Tax=Pueribacillus theae TaxID=2171751 RepID=A0A2U1K4X9_9BACI|nr:hypothetical protein [Pueribacillus theae]PWA12053.1 hypothetical protein DCC39_08210 [Pueribacillus theae]
MSTLLLIGCLFVLIVLLNKRRLARFVHSNSFFVRKLESFSWFQNEWLAGIFLFFLNAFLFGLAAAAFILTGMLPIPFFHLVVMFLATVLSIYLWFVFREAVNRGRRESFIMGSVGSSFYFLLLLIFLYMLVTLEPGTPEHDTGMAFFGLIFAMFVSLVAFVTCFWITGLSKKSTTK